MARDYANEHLARHKAAATGHDAVVVPHFVCRDGTTLSVQASLVHYCSPRNDVGPWTHVEVWCVAAAGGRKIRPRSFGRYTGEPYGCVPVEAVNRFIHRHGGLD